MKSAIVIPTSNALTPEKLEGVKRAAAWAEQDLGWRVSIDSDLLDRHSWGGACSPQQRAEKLMSGLETQDAVFGAVGGNHGGEILPYLDADRLKNAQGSFVGTSDNSMIALVLSRYGVSTFCGPDLKLKDPEEIDVELGRSTTLDFSFTKQCLAEMFDQPGWRHISEAQEIKRSRVLRAGYANGRLLAGNVSAFLKLAGTPWWPTELLDGSILCIERHDAESDSAVAEVVQLCQLGVFNQISGLIVGYTDGLELQRSVAEVEEFFQAVLDLTSSREIPVYHLGLFGHYCPHALLPNLAESKLVDGQLHVNWPAL